MATPTYDLLDSTTLTSSASSVTFSSISQDYRDLVLVFECQGSLSARVNGYLNGDTGTNYFMVSMENDGGAVSDSGSSLAFFNAGLVRSDHRAINRVNFMDYSATDKHKTMLQREDAALARLGARAMRWANTAAITSIEVAPTSGTFDTGSTFYLFGIAA